MINLTDAAHSKLKSFMAEEKKKSHGLRIQIVGGGCSGLSYKMEFQEDPGKGDKVFEVRGLFVFVDAKSYLYVKGLTIDYSGGLNGTGFTFNNPVATSGCGCGTSFNVTK